MIERTPPGAVLGSRYVRPMRTFHLRRNVDDPDADPIWSRGKAGEIAGEGVVWGDETVSLHLFSGFFSEYEWPEWFVSMDSMMANNADVTVVWDTEEVKP